MRNATLKDIAARTDLSVSGVSLALRGSAKVSKATQARVRALADDLGYVPRPALAAAASGRFRNKSGDGMERLAFLWSVVDDDLAVGHAQLTFGLLEKTGKTIGYRVLNCPTTAEETPALLRKLHKKGVVGIVLGGWIGAVPPDCAGWKKFSVIRLGGTAAASLPVHVVKEDLFDSAFHKLDLNC